MQHAVNDRGLVVIRSLVEWRGELGFLRPRRLTIFERTDISPDANWRRPCTDDRKERSYK